METLPERSRRHCVRLEASATRANGTEVKAIVTDLSLDGCCLIGPFRVGEKVTVRIPKVGSLAAEIRWAFMGRAGARFATETKRKLDSRGAAAIEYALLASLVALALVASLARLGGNVESRYDSVDNAVGEGTRFEL